MFSMSRPRSLSPFYSSHIICVLRRVNNVQAIKNENFFFFFNSKNLKFDFSVFFPKPYFPALVLMKAASKPTDRLFDGTRRVDRPRQTFSTLDPASFLAARSFANAIGVSIEQKTVNAAITSARFCFQLTTNRRQFDRRSVRALPPSRPTGNQWSGTADQLCGRPCLR